ARIYGLQGRKGSIAIGADADIVLWQTDTPRRVANADLHHNVDYTPYEGIEVTTWPDTVLSRGEVVLRDGTPVAGPGRGAFLRCDRIA
ncbi:MAG: amidohydrolase family protein, partial [Rhodospirillales bacterium]|nr:amidohydrolase family protein [Rhodospirillales bacterium]